MVRKNWGERFNEVQRFKAKGIALAGPEASEDRPLLVSTKDDICPLVDKIVELTADENGKIVNVSVKNDELEKLFEDVLNKAVEQGRLDETRKSRVLVRSKAIRKRKSMKEAFEESYDQAAAGGPEPEVPKTAFGSLNLQEELHKAENPVVEEAAAEVEVEKEAEEEGDSDESCPDSSDEPAIQPLAFEEEQAPEESDDEEAV